MHEASELAPNQQTAVVYLAKELNATLLTEEMVDITTLSKYIPDKQLMEQIDADCMRLLQKKESSFFPLRGLSLFARSRGVNAYSADYRQWADPFRCGRLITGKMAMKVLDKVIEEIDTYDDNPIFNNYYQEKAEMVKMAFAPLWDHLRMQNKLIGELCMTPEFQKIVALLYNPQENEYSECWVMYDSSIFDCLLLHNLAQNNNEHIIICAGDYHCEKIKTLLMNCGYKEMYILGQPDSKEIVPIDIKNFIGHILNIKESDFSC